MQINVLRTKYLLSELERQILSLDNALSDAKKTIEQIETESAYDNLILHDASRAIYNINIYLLFRRCSFFQKTISINFILLHIAPPKDFIS